MNRFRGNPAISFILLLFMALALAYSVVNPLHEATDEIRHYRFVRYIVVNGSLPVQGAGACRTQSHHPPLFYALGALLTAPIETGRAVCHNLPENPFWAYRYADVGVDNKNLYLHGPDEAFPWRGEALAVHLLRGLNVFFGAVTVWFTWATGRAIWPERPALAAGATAFVAFNPMFLFLSGAINNDVVAAAAGAAILYACVRLLQSPVGLTRRWGWTFGLLYGLALLSKFNMAAFALPIAFSATYVAARRRQWRPWLDVGLLTAGVVALVAGWWFVRNQILYGEPTGFQKVTELWGVRSPSESLPIAISELPHAWTTLWGRFGYGQIPLPDAIYRLLAWIVGLGLVGTALAVASRLIRRRPLRTPMTILALLAGIVLLAFAVLFNYMLLSPAGAMGRFFFPGLPALSLLVFFGIVSSVESVMQRPGWTIEKRERLTRSVAWVANLGMASIATVALFGYLAPAYARPPGYTAGTPVPNPVTADFAGIATLQGYRLSAGTLRPGELLDLDLYWEVTKTPPGNFLLFVHLIDEAGTMVVQRDTHPGTGTFPTRQWQPGDRFVDSIRLFVPETAYTPVTATVSVGLSGPDYRLPVSGANGTPIGDALPLADLEIVPATDLYPGAAEIPNPLDQNFGDRVRLGGYAYSHRAPQAGDVLALTLYWQTLAHTPKSAAPSSDLALEITLLNSGGEVRNRYRRPLAVEAAENDGFVESVLLLHLDGTLPPGTYSLRLAVYESGTDLALAIIAEDGHWIGQYLDLAGFRLFPDT